MVIEIKKYLKLNFPILIKILVTKKKSRNLKYFNDFKIWSFCKSLTFSKKVKSITEIKKDVAKKVIFLFNK